MIPVHVLRQLGVPMLRALIKHLDKSLTELDRLRCEPCSCVRDDRIACDHDIASMCFDTFTTARRELGGELVRRARLVLVGGVVVEPSVPVPPDYEPCGLCGFDHAYEPAESAGCPGVRS